MYEEADTHKAGYLNKEQYGEFVDAILAPYA